MSCVYVCETFISRIHSTFDHVTKSVVCSIEFCAAANESVSQCMYYIHQAHYALITVDVCLDSIHCLVYYASVRMRKRGIR